MGDYRIVSERKHETKLLAGVSGTIETNEKTMTVLFVVLKINTDKKRITYSYFAKFDYLCFG